MKKFILIGDSGHAKVIEDIIIANNDVVTAKLDDKYLSKFKEGPYIKGPLSCIHEILDADTKVVIAIGNNVIRKRIVEILKIDDTFYDVLKHPSAVISPSVQIEVGTVIMANVVINAEATIGKHSIINTSSVVEHDCRLSNYVHISPGAILTGGVHVGEGTQVGAQSVAIPLVKIGKWSMIGAGSTVIKDVENNVTAVGSPAKEIRKKDL